MEGKLITWLQEQNKVLGDNVKSTNDQWSTLGVDRLLLQGRHEAIAAVIQQIEAFTNEITKAGEGEETTVSTPIAK